MTLTILPVTIARPVLNDTKVRGDDLEFVRKVLDGNNDAVSQLQTRYHARLQALLCARGANLSEAEDLLHDIWSDCFGATDPPRRLLSAFKGRCSLESWLATVAINRLIDLKRKQAARRDSRFSQRETYYTDDPYGIVARPQSQIEYPLLEILRSAIATAFSNSDPEILLMLKLVDMHGVNQREVGRMWRWHESKVSRHLERARENIKEQVLNHIRAVDPWLILSWNDFVDLCSSSSALVV